jgi:hypothetical protein
VCPSRQLLLGDACTDEPTCTAAEEAGAAAAIVRAMSTLPSDADMQQAGCHALRQMCAHRATAAEACIVAGAAKVVVAALDKKALAAKTSPARVLAVREKACAALAEMGTRGSAARVLPALVEAGAIEGACFVLKEHRKQPSAAGKACAVVASICTGGKDDAAAKGRRDRAVEAGCIPQLVWALRRHKKLSEVVDPGRGALILICYSPELQEAAFKAGADPNWSPRQTDR